MKKMISAPTAIESVATIENLNEFIEIARQIERDIEDHGFYPDQDHIPQEQRRKLQECPLEVSGLRSIYSTIAFPPHSS